MKTINRKPLFLALAGISALGAVGSAQAVSVSPTGLGSFLYYPYYTVKGDTNPFNTLLSIVNTTGSTKALKIRFREGKASAEVLDFNIFLSPYDVWTAALLQSESGGVKLFTEDRSCTIPTIPDAGVEFRNSKYVGDEVKDNSLQRLREGYFEVIEMATFTDGSTIAVNSKHGANRIPKDCSKVTTPTALIEQQPQQGGVMGTASLVSPGSGLNAATDPTVLLNFSNSPLYFGTNEDQPLISDADPWSVTAMGNGNSYHAVWNTGEDAVSAALMKQAIMNEFVLDPGTASATDWVITFPTKSFYVNNKSSADPQKLFTEGMHTSGSCDPIEVNTWDREEQTKAPGGDDFSPAPPPDQVDLCWEANVLTFNGKNVFNSSQTLSLATAFINGWARIDFFPENFPLIPTAGTLIQQNTFSVFTSSVVGSFTGLPVIGFAVQTFRPTLTSSFAGTFYHRFIPGTPPNLNISAQ